MKTARRHELKESELAQALLNARDYVVEHRTGIGFAVIAAAAVIAVVGLTVRSRAAAIEDAWRSKDELVYSDPQVAKESLERLRVITEESTDEAFILVSLLEQGMRGLSQVQQVKDPPDAELNAMARKAFEHLLDRFPDNPLAIGRARCGLATVEENAFVLDGDLSHKERALAHLRAIIDDDSLSLTPFVRIAADRIEALDETFTPVTFAPPPAAPEPITFDEVKATYDYGADTPIRVTPVTTPDKEPSSPEQPEKDED